MFFLFSAILTRSCLKGHGLGQKVRIAKIYIGHHVRHEVDGLESKTNQKPYHDMFFCQKWVRIREGTYHFQPQVRIAKQKRPLGAEKYFFCYPHPRLIACLLACLLASLLPCMPHVGEDSKKKHCLGWAPFR